ncbi:MAG: cell division FtsZ family protein [Deltaproteobacteria bacterium]|jgi:cell division protein FtsZ|nr:cell division FtsZ family protein [Deltaproteobacteria bacterium]
MSDFIESVDEASRAGLDQIRVIGLGGCGCNTITHLANYGLKGPKLIAANSDLQALERCEAANKVILGPKCTHGTGCGGNPEKGREAAMESKDVLLEQLLGAKIVFITAGMGGGTGTGAAPVLAEAISKLPDRPLLVAVILLPFGYEESRMTVGKMLIRDLSHYCNSIIPVYNDKLIKHYPKAKFTECVKMADDILLRAVACVTDLIQNPGLINLDLSDICSALEFKGKAIMGCGEASGEDRAEIALRQAIDSPLMADISIEGAKALLVNITADDDILMGEFAYINESLKKIVGRCGAVFSGIAIDNRLKETGTLKLTVIATGLGLEEEMPIELPLEQEAVITLAPEPIIQQTPEQFSQPQPMTGQVAAGAQGSSSIMHSNPVNNDPPQKRVIRLGGVSNRNPSGYGKPSDGDSQSAKFGGKNIDEPSFMRNRQD